MYNPRLGRFLSLDPLQKVFAYLTPYQYASNTPIQAIDLDGLEAWKVTRQWSSTDNAGFAAYTKAKLKEYSDKKIKDDCANFALRLIAGYAAENGLPLVLRNGAGTSYDASSTNYKSLQQYLNDILPNIQAIDLLDNTYPIAQDESQGGDLELLHYSILNSKKVNLNHTVIITDYFKDDKRHPNIAWGDEHLSTGAGELLRFQSFDWPRYARGNDGTTNAWTFWTGWGNNSRWNVLSPSNTGPGAPEGGVPTHSDAPVNLPPGDEFGNGCGVSTPPSVVPPFSGGTEVPK